VKSQHDDQRVLVDVVVERAEKLRDEKWQETPFAQKPVLGAGATHCNAVATGNMSGASSGGMPYEINHGIHRIDQALLTAAKRNLVAIFTSERSCFSKQTQPMRVRLFANVAVDLRYLFISTTVY
jgi:hypothetical protein